MSLGFQSNPPCSIPSVINVVRAIGYPAATNSRNSPSKRGRHLSERKKLCNNCLCTGHFVHACPKESFCKVEGCTSKHSTILHPKTKHNLQRMEKKTLKRTKMPKRVKAKNITKVIMATSNLNLPHVLQLQVSP